MSFHRTLFFFSTESSANEGIDPFAIDNTKYIR